MRRIIGGILSLILLVGMVGCSTSIPEVQPPKIPTDGTPTIPTGNPPMGSTWISPGKVMVTNFHLGARAECAITIHSSPDKEGDTPFKVAYRGPDHVEVEYLRAPTEVVQDWVLVADTTPVLAPNATQDVLIALVMPENVEDSDAVVYQLTDIGTSYLNDCREQTIWNQEKFDTLVEEYETTQVLPSDLAKVKAGEMLNSELMGMPYVKSLVYLERCGSVSEGKLLSDNEVPQGDLTSKYVVMGDLRIDRWEFWISVMDASQGGQVVTELCSRWLISMRSG